MAKEKLQLIGVKKETKMKLDELGNKGDTYDDVVWRLIENE